MLRLILENRRLAAAMLVVAVLCTQGRRPTALGDETTGSLPQVKVVRDTFDGRPFEYRIESQTQKSGYRILRLTYPSPVTTPTPQNNTVPAEYYLPDGVGPDGPARPAVICMHILEGDFVLVRITCSMLASHGIPAVMFKLPYYGERELPGGRQALAADPVLFMGAIEQAMEDVRRTVDLLASRPEVDREKIGITGISLGGIVAATAAGRDPRLFKAALILAGGDLDAIIHHAMETGDLSRLIHALPPDRRAEVELAIDAVDPLRHAHRLRDRARAGRVLMVNAAEDDVIPPACTERLAAALGIRDRVVWLEGLGHYTAMAELPQLLKTTAEFFGEDLPAGIEGPSTTARQRTPLEVVLSIVQQALTMLVAEPDQGRCHFADLDVSVTPPGERTVAGRLTLIRGHGGRFKLECGIPAVGEASIGQSHYPWMVSRQNVLFQGDGQPADEPADPFAFAEPEHLAMLRMMAGGVAGLAIAPHLANQWVDVSDATPHGGPTAIRIAAKDRQAGSLLLVLKGDGLTPRELTFDLGGARGKVTFRRWLTDTVAHDAMFAPPAGLRRQTVDAVDLHRMFSAMFNFAMESL
jgi:dienelactone hydrolase